MNITAIHRQVRRTIRALSKTHRELCQLRTCFERADKPALAGETSDLINQVKERIHKLEVLL